jgi:hypothetical protein
MMLNQQLLFPLLCLPTAPNYKESCGAGHIFGGTSQKPATSAPSSCAVHGSVTSHPSAMSRTTTSIHHAYEPSLADNTSSDRWFTVISMQGRLTTPIHHPSLSASLNELTRGSSTTVGYDGQMPIRIPEYPTSTISELDQPEQKSIPYTLQPHLQVHLIYSNNNGAVETDLSSVECQLYHLINLHQTSCLFSTATFKSAFSHKFDILRNHKF